MTAPTWRPSLAPPPWHAVTTSTAFRRSVRIHTRPWSTGMSSNSGSGDRGIDSPLLPLLALLALLSVRLGEAGGASGWFFFRRHRQRRDDRRLRHLHAPCRTRGRGTHALMLILGRRPDGHDHPARARLRLRVMNEHMGGPSAPEHGGIDFGIGIGMSNNARHERGQTLWQEDVGCGSSPPTSC